MSELNSLQRHRILHVDDEQSQLDEFNDFVRNYAAEKFQVSGFKSAELALSVLAKDDSFDLCIVDLQLVSKTRDAFRTDVWGGLQFVETAKILSPNTSFLVLSSMTPTIKIRSAAAEVGCIGFIQKLHIKSSKRQLVVDQLISASLYCKLFTRRRSDARLSFSESMAHSLKRELDKQIDKLDEIKAELDESATESSASSLVTEVLKDQKHMKEVLSHALKFYTRNAIEAENVNISALIKSLIAKHAFNANIRFDSKGLLENLVYCDPRLVEIAVSNLVQNSIDATDWKGEERQIEILLESKISVNGIEYISIEVRDNGLGLQVGTERLVLQPMYSGENVNKGRIRFGIGCAEADRIARLHHNQHMSGSLSVENRKDVRGCKACLTIPRFLEFERATTEK